MSSRTSRFFLPLFATGLAAALAACGGGQTPQPAGPGGPGGPGDGTAVVAPPAGGGEAAAAGGGAPAAPKVTKPGPNVTPDGVVFNTLVEGKGHRIFLAGTFNNWSKDDEKFLLKDDDGDGVWSITVKLVPGTYQYKYVIDGKWTQDSYAPSEAPDGFGGQNSKFDVK